jgi:hypothetical protein
VRFFVRHFNDDDDDDDDGLASLSSSSSSSSFSSSNPAMILAVYTGQYTNAFPFPRSFDS